MSSNGWFYVIVYASIVGAFAAGSVAVANNRYQRAREAERDAEARSRETERDARLAREASQREAQRFEQLANEARAALLPELKRNVELLGSIESGLTPTQVPLVKLQTAAWDTVSRGELLRGFRGEELSTLLTVYALTNRTNEALEQLVKFSVGVEAAMGGAAQSRESFRENLRNLLHQLRPRLTEAVANAHRAASMGKATN
jgi:hypothetical protein